MISLYNFLAEALSNTCIYEMATDRDRYAKLCEDLYQQILENIACILYAQENKVSQENIRHWLTELTSYVHRLRKMQLNKKISKSRVIKQALDTMNADDRYHVREDLRKKFNKEQFDLNSFSYDAQGELIHFLHNDLIEIIEAQPNRDMPYEHDTFQRLANALNINI